MPVLSRLLSAGRSPSTPTARRRAGAARALHGKVGATFRGELRRDGRACACASRERADNDNTTPPAEAQAQPGPCPSPASFPGPTGPALRANPCPEVTDPVCRLPLPTLFYRLEAAHLGDLLRIWVRPGARFTGLHGVFKGRRRRAGHRQSRGALQDRDPYLRASRFQGLDP